MIFFSVCLYGRVHWQTLCVEPSPYLYFLLFSNIILLTAIPLLSTVILNIFIYQCWDIFTKYFFDYWSSSCCHYFLLLNEFMPLVKHWPKLTYRKGRLFGFYFNVIVHHYGWNLKMESGEKFMQRPWINNCDGLAEKGTEPCG